MIAGALALGAHGYERVTADVNVLLTREGLERLKQHHLGRGYVEKFPGSKGLRDATNGVSIDVLIAGDRRLPRRRVPEAREIPGSRRAGRASSSS